MAPMAQASALREAMNSQIDLGERFEPLDHGYKELEIPPREGKFLRDAELERAAHMAARQLRSASRCRIPRASFHRHAVSAERGKSQFRDDHHQQ